MPIIQSIIRRTTLKRICTMMIIFLIGINYLLQFTHFKESLVNLKILFEYFTLL